MVRLIAFLLILAGNHALAQAWTYGSFDNGSWFEAHVSHNDREIAFHCGGASPGGLPLPQSDEPLLTAPYAVDLTLAHPTLGGDDHMVSPPPRNDLVLSTGTTGFRLPRAVYDELNASGWIQPLSISDGLIAALLSGGAVSLQAGNTRVARYDGAGLPAALTRMIAFCDARWAATGVPLPTPAVSMINAVRQQGVDISPTVSAEPRALDPGDLWASVQRHLAESCGGAVRQVHDNFAMAANLDGDGRTDYVIAWDSIECAGSMSRPFCGASQCAVDVFVSSAFPVRGRPESIYAQAVEVIAGSQGRDILRLAGRLANCRAPGAPPDCLFLWGWTNGSLQRLN